MKQCPSCKETYDDSFMLCRKCNVELKEQKLSNIYSILPIIFIILSIVAIIFACFKYYDSVHRVAGIVTTISYMIGYCVWLLLAAWLIKVLFFRKTKGAFTLIFSILVFLECVSHSVGMISEVRQAKVGAKETVGLLENYTSA